MASREGYVVRCVEERDANEEFVAEAGYRVGSVRFGDPVLDDTYATRKHLSVFVELDCIQDWETHPERLSYDLKRRLAVELRTRGLEGLSELNEELADKIQDNPWIFPIACRREFMVSLSLEKPFTTTLHRSLRFVLRDEDIREPAFSHWWNAISSPDVRCWIFVLALEVPVLSCRSLPVVAAALDLLAIATPTKNEIPITRRVISYLDSVSAYADPVHWAACLIHWAAMPNSGREELVSEILATAQRWFVLNRTRLSARHFQNIASINISTPQLRQWALARAAELGASIG